MQYRSQVAALLSRVMGAVSVQPMLGSRANPDELTLRPPAPKCERSLSLSVCSLFCFAVLYFIFWIIVCM